MTARTVNQSGGPAPDYSTLNAAVAASSAADTIEIQGTWSADDTTSVVWDVAVIVTADSDSQQIGRPWVSGDTHYRHREGSGHAFTVTADVVITGIDIQSDSTGVSDELFRAAGGDGCVITNCMLGFTGNTDQQDVWYTEVTSTRTLECVQCFFYDVGRSVVDISLSGSEGALTINFNSCTSLNIGANGGRNNGTMVGMSGGGVSTTLAVNGHSCIFQDPGSTKHFSADTAITFDVDYMHSISNRPVDQISSGDDTEDLDGTDYEYTYTADTDPGAGDFVIYANITSTTYDPTLIDDADNDAIGFHATVTATAASLELPQFDIVGRERKKSATPSFEPGVYAITLEAAGGLGIPIAMHNYRMRH